jgi:hypothetical protein
MVKRVIGYLLGLFLTLLTQALLLFLMLVGALYFLTQH